MNNILITGSSGQLGSAIKNSTNRHSNINFIFANRKLLDIRDYKQCEMFLKNYNISYIINCAAYTNVDNAEKCINTPDNDAYLTNSIGPKNLAIISKQNNIKLIHISTDYVYNNNLKTPFKETDTLAPINYYGKTKLIGEENIRNNLHNYIVIRTGWLYYYLGHNFFNTISSLLHSKPELNIVSDQFGTPTYCGDLADIILFIINKDIANKNNNFFGNTFNFSNLGACSWYDFAIKINEHIGSDCVINAITSEEYNAIAKRPSYSVLDKSKIMKTFNYNIPSWREGLAQCLNEQYIHNNCTTN